MQRALVHVGFGNYVEADRIKAAEAPHSAPVQRIVRRAKQEGMVIDITCGRRTKAVVFTDTGDILLLGITPQILGGRVAAARVGDLSRRHAD